MKLNIFTFLTLICGLYVAVIHTNTVASFMPLCQNSSEIFSNHSVLYHNMSSNSTFCYCTMQSNHSFTLSIKRIIIKTTKTCNDSQAMYFYNGLEENKTCDRINLMDVYNDPLGPDCLAEFSPNQSSTQYCWSNNTNVSAFGFFQHLASSMGIYLTLKGDGIIHINCNHSAQPPSAQTSNDSCAVQTNAENNNTANNNTDNNSMNTIETTSEKLTTNSNDTIVHKELNQQNSDDHFNMTDMGILLVCVGGLFLLLSVILFALSFRKRCLSRKEHPEADSVVKKISTLSTATSHESMVHYEDITDNDVSVVRKTSSLHEPVYKPPLCRRYTDGNIDMEVNELERKPYHTAMKDLNSKDDRTEMHGNADIQNQYVETEGDKNKLQTVNANQQDNENIHKFNTTEENFMNPAYVLTDQPIKSSTESHPAKQNNVSAVSYEKGLETVYEMETLPSTEKNLIHEPVLCGTRCSMDRTKDLHKSSKPLRPPQSTAYSKSQPVNSDEEANPCVKNDTKTYKDLNQLKKPDTQCVDVSSHDNIRSPEKLDTHNHAMGHKKMAVDISVNSIPPSLDTKYEEPDYETISSSDDETESRMEQEKQTEKKTTDSKSKESQSNPVVRKESVKVIFLKPKVPASSKEEELCPGLYHREKTTPPLVRMKQAISVQMTTPPLKQARSVDVDWSKATRMKPTAPKRSMSDDIFFKSSDAVTKTESQTESQQENHLYEEVDDMKESSLSAMNTTQDSEQEHNETANESCDDAIHKDKIKPTDQENQAKKVIEQEDNETAKESIDDAIHQENLDHMMDNELYSMGNDDFNWSVHAAQENNEKDQHINKASLEPTVKCDSTAQNPPDPTTGDDMTADEDYMIDNALYSMNSQL